LQATWLYFESSPPFKGTGACPSLRAVKIFPQSFNNHNVTGLRGKVFVAGGYRGGFCEKLRDASPMSDKANASQL